MPNNTGIKKCNIKLQTIFLSQYSTMYKTYISYRVTFKMHCNAVITILSVNLSQRSNKLLHVSHASHPEVKWAAVATAVLGFTTNKPLNQQTNNKKSKQTNKPLSSGDANDASPVIQKFK